MDAHAFGSPQASFQLYPKAAMAAKAEKIELYELLFICGRRRGLPEGTEVHWAARLRQDRPPDFNPDVVAGRTRDPPAAEVTGGTMRQHSPTPQRHRRMPRVLAAQHLDPDVFIAQSWTPLWPVCPTSPADVVPMSARICLTPLSDVLPSPEVTVGRWGNDGDLLVLAKLPPGSPCPKQRVRIIHGNTSPDTIGEFTSDGSEEELVIRFYEEDHHRAAGEENLVISTNVVYHLGSRVDVCRWQCWPAQRLKPELAGFT